MTTEQIIQINNLRNEGKGYRTIASELNMPVNSVKSWCRRHPLKAAGEICLQCGAEIHSLPHKRKRKFCTDECRNRWWSEHPEKRINGKYQHSCKFCGTHFTNSRIKADYCSRVCYAKARMKVTVDG